MIGMLKNTTVAVDAYALEVIVHDEVDHARDRIGAVHRRGAAGQYINSIHERRRDLIEVGGCGPVLSGSPGMRRRPSINTKVR